MKTIEHPSLFCSLSISGIGCIEVGFLNVENANMRYRTGAQERFSAYHIGGENVF